MYAFCGEKQLSEDCAQEGFARALVRWRRLKQEPWAGAWVTTVAINACRKALKRTESGSASKESSTGTDIVEERQDLIWALRQLPRRQREAVVLHYLTDSPIVTVAHLMNVSEGSVKTHLARARATLRKLLEEVDV